MKLSVATNFDNRLLADMAGHHVEEVYGKLPRDVAGGGRASYSTGATGMPQLESHIQAAHDNGIRFNYLLNAVCLGNREWSRSGIKAIRELLDKLAMMRVDAITVSTPYLAEVIKKHYPMFRLKIGIFANIDTPTRAKFWQDLGADTLVLESFSINRRFPLLKSIRESVACELQLIANFTCLPNCPMQIYHMTGISHGSNTVDKVPFIDYCILKCSAATLNDPALLIKSNWIRPEDTDRYEQMGFSSFKLLERNAPSDLMLKRVQAYSSKTSPANFLELIQPFGFNKNIKMQFGWIPRLILERPRLILPLYQLLKTRGMLFSLQGTPAKIDSAKIPANFLDEISRRPCSKNLLCQNCNYCDQISTAAYSIDPTYHQECTRLYKRVFKLLC
ncbi:MAG: peptidase U32 [Candidatus Riflebacteria bacterium HGW-Riflebacteria-1]|jgi:collagenase-like PrtC family protease|nr:MAG: peptidase U32 [Candidatus Riflebacteria bacterium HGW-Riflebacteria-1]